MQHFCISHECNTRSGCLTKLKEEWYFRRTASSSPSTSSSSSSSSSTWKRIKATEFNCHQVGIEQRLLLGQFQQNPKFEQKTTFAFTWPHIDISLKRFFGNFLKDELLSDPQKYTMGRKCHVLRICCSWDFSPQSTEPVFPQKPRNSRVRFSNWLDYVVWEYLDIWDIITMVTPHRNVENSK